MTSAAGGEAERAAQGWSAVAEALEIDIIFGRLFPRQHLVEDDLMRRFDASRYAVRRALEEMQAIGLVVKEANRGVHVRGYSPDEVEGLFEVREALETRAATRIKLPADPAVIAELTRIERRHEEVSEKGELLEMFQLNNAFHETLYEACGNSVLAASIKLYSTQTQPIRMRFFPDEARRRQAVDDHWKMVGALRGTDNSELAALCRRHLEPTKQNYLKLYGLSAPR